MNTHERKRWGQVIRGCAYGDAWGDPNEFRGYEGLTKKGESPLGPEMPEKLRITDDTQMTLALAKALDGTPTMSDRVLRARVLDEWVSWYHDKDNNRAPGRRCLAACGVLARGGYWMDATADENDGCGTIMRNSATAFLPEGLWAPVAAWQAISTHGGTNGVAACLVAAGVMRRAVRGEVAAGELTAVAIEMADAAFDPKTDPFNLKQVGKWLAWAPGINSDDPKEQQGWLLDGMSTMYHLLEKVEAALPACQAHPWAGDPCDIGGEGWRAHHALATALLCADMLPNDPMLALRRATVTGGDSDSIAAVAGALLGAVHEDPWPAEWFGRLEPRYQEWITEATQYNFNDKEL